MAGRSKRRGLTTSRGRKSARGRMTLRGLGPILIVVVLACVVLAGLAVLPAKTWFSQRANMSAAEADLARIQAETAELERQHGRLATDDEIVLRARRDFDLVFPGEESYRIVTTEP